MLFNPLCVFEPLVCFDLLSTMSGGQSVWYQKEVSLPAKKRGCHLVTEDVARSIPELQHIKIGLAHVHSESISLFFSITFFV